MVCWNPNKLFDLSAKKGAIWNLFHTSANTKSPECALTVSFIQSAEPLNQKWNPRLAYVLALCYAYKSLTLFFFLWYSSICNFPMLYLRKHTAGHIPLCKAVSFAKVKSVCSTLCRSGYRRRLSCVFICSFAWVEKLGQYRHLSYSHFTFICLCHWGEEKKKSLNRLYVPSGSYYLNLDGCWTNRVLSCHCFRVKTIRLNGTMPQMCLNCGSV